jgi:NAD(P)-dependent dehydrogenase (short-subunit alcohol dehydrogenase family)
VTPQQFNRVFITGGASGIGLRLAELSVDAGADVAIFDSAPSSAGEARLRREAISRGRKLESLRVDVRRPQQVESAVRQAVTRLGPPDLAINSAGIQLAKPFEQLSADEFTRVIEVNLIGSRNFAAAVLPTMAAGARLALVASLAGLVPNYGYAAYSASKYGVIGLAEALRLEYKPRKIGVSVVCPPEIETPMVEEERKTEHPAGKALKDVAGTLDLDTACAEIFEALTQGKFLIIPSPRARAVVRLTKYLPSAVSHLASDVTLRRALRKPG